MRRMTVAEYRTVAHKIASRFRKVTPEGALKQQVERMLAVLPQVAWFCRMNTGAVKLGEGPRSRFVRFGYPGMADYYVRIRSRRGQPAKTIWLELKATTEPSPAQVQFGETVRSLGDEYHVVRSVEEAIVAIRGYG